MKQIKLFLTRIGDNSIFLLNGDSEQTDIHNSGFDEMFERLDVQSDNIQAVEMGINDIMRSPLVKELYRHFDKRLPPVTYKDAYKK